MMNWNPMEAIKNPMSGLRFIEFHVSHYFLTLAFRANVIKLLELPNPARVFPKVQTAPELDKYFRADNGIKIKLNSKANIKKECIGLYNPIDFDLSHPFDYLLLDDMSDIKLIYDRKYELIGPNADPENFIEIRFPYIYRCIDDFGDPRGNWLNKSRVDKYGNLIIRILPDEDE